MAEWSWERAERFTDRWLSGDVNAAAFMEGAETLLPWLLKENERLAHVDDRNAGLRDQLENNRSLLDSARAEVVSLRSQLADARTALSELFDATKHVVTVRAGDGGWLDAIFDARQIAAAALSEEPTK